MASEKKKRQEWNEADMAEALETVKEGKMGWKLAAKTFNVPATTLRRRFSKNCNSTKGDLGGRKSTLDPVLEGELASHIIDMETRFFGLGTKDLRRLVFEIAEKNHIPHTFNRESRLAGWKWVAGFLRRNRRISLRTPENTSVARAQAFNKPNIKLYFTALAAIMDQHQFPPENVYNMDESGLSTVQKRPTKIFATKGRKQVGTISSAERGQHLTVVCAMNAIGTYVPPTFIFPRKRFKNELMDSSPPGSIAFCQENGWMSSEVFVKWLKHFVHYTKASMENKILLLLDGHSSHKGLEVLEYAKASGIILFCFPAHCTHRVQPLDVGVFGPLQTYYDQAIQKWLKQNPSRSITHFQVPGLFTEAYMKSATPLNALNAFAKTGIHPFNPDVFEDWMFAPSLVTDKQQSNITEVQRNEEINDLTPDSTEPIRCSSSSTLIPRGMEFTIKDLSPVPIAQPKTNSRKGQRKGKSGLLNGTPDIDEIKGKLEEKSKKEREKLARKAKRKIVREEKEDSEPEIDADDDEDDAACLYCNGLYSLSRAREFWIRCQVCQAWCHAECAGVDRGRKRFVCELCV